MFQLICLDGQRPFQTPSNFVFFFKLLASEDLFGTTLSLDYKLIPCLRVAGEPSMPGTSFFFGMIRFFCLPLTSSIAEPCSFGYSCQPFCLDGVRRHSPRWWGNDSAPYRSVGKPGFGSGKNHRVKTQIKRICSPASSLVRVHHQLGSADEQNH